MKPRAARVWALPLALALAAAAAPAADTYYVSTAGHDTNTGTSVSAPFRTLQKAANTVQPGDTILMRPGTYAGARLERSGTSNALITLRAEVPGTAVINTNGPACKRRSNLEIETWDPPYVVRYWIVEGLVIEGLKSLGLITNYGIDARSTQFLVIRGNTVSNSAITGIFTAFSYDCTIEGNTSAYNGEHGIYYNNSSDRFTIRGNTLHHNANAGLHMNADATIAPGGGTPWVGDGIISDGVIENNTIYANGKGGAAINMDGVENTLVRNNLIHTTTNNSGIALFRGNAAIASRRNRIFNNTIVMAAQDPGWAVNLTSADCVSNQVFNNILYNPHGFRGSISIAVPNLDGFASDYNAVVNRFSADGGGGNMGLAAWQALGYDTHSLLAVPSNLFVNATSNFRLRAGSPAIDRGTPRPEVPADHAGLARPLDGNADGTNAWDLGALEYAHATADSDRDGAADAAEFTAGTDATNPASRLAMSALNPQPESVVLEWPSAAGRRYALGSSTNLAGAAFLPGASNLPATPPLNVHTVAVPPTASSTFWRVSVEP